MGQNEGAVTPETRLVELHFQPLWRYIDGIRDFCGFFARTTFDDQEVGDRVGLVVHELVENAIRYSTREADAILELTVLLRGSEIELTVANTADEGQLQALIEQFSLANQGDPLSAYLDAMKRTRTRPPGESGLGLPRIRYEGRMTLELVTEARLVRVSARGTI